MGNNSDEHYTLLTDYDTGSAYSNAFHMAFANIRLDWDSSQIKQLALLLTTPTDSASQVTVAANLAIVAAQSNTPTLLVDADLRHPGLQQRFGLGDGAGISHLLTEEVLTPEKIASSVNTTFIPGLRLLCAGAPTETGLLPFASRLEGLVSALRQFLAETEKQPGMIVFSSPPVLNGPDASLLSALVDQVFLVIVTGRTTRSQAKQAQEQLQRAHAHLAGTILVKP
ncbi:MAG: CpsD/CapB family tyrosine-protein kinase [Chloroflexota bacterium]|nr:CpsD/CapB family tyrosine-protein kinase [Chloroflexota bacterium]